MADHARLDLLLDGLLYPGEIDRLVAGAEATAAASFPALRARVERHLEAVEKAAAENGGVDVAVARRVAGVLTDLLDEVAADPGAYSEEARALLRGAVEYFVLDQDGDADCEPGIGFDDDARILNAVLVAIGHPQRRVEP